MARPPVPLKSWEAVIPGVVFPLLGLWLGGKEWGARGIACAANLAPLLVLVVLARFGGRRVPAVQGAATFAYGLLAAAWIGHRWDVPGFVWLGERVTLLAPLLAAGVALALYPVIAAVLRVAALDAGPPPEAT